MPATGEIMDTDRELAGVSRQIAPRAHPGDAPAGSGDGAILDRAIGGPAHGHGGEPAVHPEIVPHMAALRRLRELSGRLLDPMVPCHKTTAAGEIR